MSWGVKKNPTLLGLNNQFNLLKWSHNHSLNLDVLHLENVGEKNSVMVHPLVSLWVFIIIPSKVESLNSRASTMYSTCFTREQVHNTFTVIFRFVIYFVTLLCNKTLKNICIVNMKSSLTSTFVKTRWSTFTQKRLYYSPKQILSKTKTCVK